jgi:hypothetical protein
MSDTEDLLELMQTLLENVECEVWEVPALTIQHPEGWAIVVTKGNLKVKLPALLEEGFKVSAIGKITLH